MHGTARANKKRKKKKGENPIEIGRLKDRVKAILCHTLIDLGVD